MSRYFLGRRSRRNLAGVYPPLVQVVYRAIDLTGQDFGIPEYGGARDEVTQARFLARGTSQTMDSHHLIQPDGFGHAVDLVPFFGGKLQWTDKERWRYSMIAGAVYGAAILEGISGIEWGGDWAWFDGAHFQIPYQP